MEDLEPLDFAPPLKLFTSYYSAGKLIRESGLAAVRTSIGGPRFPLSYPLAGACSLLMPRRNMLKLSFDEYRPAYRAILDQHGLDAILDNLAGISRCHEGRGLVLLCFENLAKPDLWCHRRLFAEWWEEQTGQAVPELEAALVPARGPTQPSLFD